MIISEAKYADLMERTLYNAFLAGLSLDGEHYIYANPLQVREDHVARQRRGLRAGALVLFCSPNSMRMLSSLSTT
jgi:uncharacterized protein